MIDMIKSAAELRVTEEIDSTIEKSEYIAPTKAALLFLKDILEKYLNQKLFTQTSTTSPLSKKLERDVESLTKLGIIGHNDLYLDYYADEPRMFSTHVAEHGYGHDYFNLNSAFQRAIGEAVERHLWFESDKYYRNKYQIESYQKVKNSRTLDIFSVVGFDSKLRNKYPILKFDENTPLAWIKARNLINDKKYLCPLSLFSPKYTEESKEPFIRHNVSTGLATASTKQEAELKGMLEIIERDAFMVTYLNKLTPPQIDLEKTAKKNKRIQHILEQAKRYHLEIQAVSLVTDFPVFVTLGVIKDKTGQGPAICVGACADFDQEYSAERALTEATALRLYLKGVYTDKTPIEEMDRLGRLVYWAQPENVSELDFLTNGKKIASERKEKVSIKEQYETLISHSRENNIDFYALPMSTKKLMALDYYTTYVMSPQLQPLHLIEKIPYFSGPRISDLPKKMGYEPAKKVNVTPHPFP